MAERTFTMNLSMDYEMHDSHGALVPKFNPLDSAFLDDIYLDDDNIGSADNAFNLYCSKNNIPAGTNPAMLSAETLFSLIEYKFMLEIKKRCQTHFYAFYGDEATLEYDYIYLMFHNKDVLFYGDKDSAEIADKNKIVSDINEKFKSFVQIPNIKNQIDIFNSNAELNKQAYANNQPAPFPNNDDTARAFLVQEFYKLYPDIEKDISDKGFTVSLKWRTMISDRFVRKINKYDRKYHVVDIPEIGYRKVTDIKGLHAHLIAHSILSDESVVDLKQNDCFIQRAIGQFNVSSERNIEKSKSNATAFAYLFHATQKAIAELKMLYALDELIVFAQYFDQKELTDKYGRDFSTGHKFDKNSRDVKAAMEKLEGSALFNKKMDYRKNNIFDFETDKINKFLFDELIIKKLGGQTKRERENNKYKELSQLIEHIYYELEYNPFYTLDNAHTDCISAPCFFKKDKSGYIDKETLYLKYERDFEKKYRDKLEHIAKYFSRYNMNRLTVFIGGSGGIGKSEFLKDVAGFFARKAGSPDGFSVYSAPVFSKKKTFDPLGNYQGEMVYLGEEARGYSYGLDECLSMFDPLHVGHTSSRNKDKDGLFSVYNLLCNSTGLMPFLSQMIKSYLETELFNKRAESYRFDLLGSLWLTGTITNNSIKDLTLHFSTNKYCNRDNNFIAIPFLKNEQKMIDTILKNGINHNEAEENFKHLPTCNNYAEFTININNDIDLLNCVVDELGQIPFLYRYTERGYNTNVSSYYSNMSDSFNNFVRDISPDILDKIWQVCRRFGVFVNLYFDDCGDTLADVYVLNYNSRKKYKYLVGDNMILYYEKFKTGVPVSDFDFSHLIYALNAADEHYYKINHFEKKPYPTTQDIYDCVHGILAEAEDIKLPPAPVSPAEPVNDDVVMFEDFKEFFHPEIFKNT